MKTKIILAIVAVALVAAALVGVTAAQFANTQTPIHSGPNGQDDPSVTGNNGVFHHTASTAQPANLTATTTAQALLLERHKQQATAKTDTAATVTEHKTQNQNQSSMALA